jgi:DNA polymerase I-like protein with 3'-5' exonuclease and polymerase domains
MVAKTIALPNIKNAFIPDPGYMMGDFDLKGADAQVVAWEANDQSLMEFFQKNEGSIHDLNAATMDVPRPQAKAGCHLTNYGGRAKTLAATTGMSIPASQAFQDKWFSLHPGIKEWHERTMHSLYTTRTISNIFGYRRIYYDRIDEFLLPQALAWIPQSTVGLIISKAAVRLYKEFPWIQVLLQVHDSLVVQFPINRKDEAVAAILSCLAVELPYPVPLTIPSSYKLSTESWGKCA